MTIKIREYDATSTGDNGNQLQVPLEPGITRTLTSGVAVKLRSDTVLVAIFAADGAMWDINTAATVDSSAGAPVPTGGIWAAVKQRQDMYVEVTES